jgi:uncharacterized coiled-coil protein SlyX
MFAKNKDILALQDSVDNLEEKARSANNHMVDTVEELQDAVEDNTVDINEIQEKLDILCQHLGANIEYKGDQRTYVVTTTKTNNN